MERLTKVRLVVPESWHTLLNSPRAGQRLMTVVYLVVGGLFIVGCSYLYWSGKVASVPGAPPTRSDRVSALIWGILGAQLMLFGALLWPLAPARGAPERIIHDGEPAWFIPRNRRSLVLWALPALGLLATLTTLAMMRFLSGHREVWWLLGLLLVGCGALAGLTLRHLLQPWRRGLILTPTRLLIDGTSHPWVDVLDVAAGSVKSPYTSARMRFMVPAIDVVTLSAPSPLVQVRMGSMDPSVDVADQPASRLWPMHQLPVHPVVVFSLLKWAVENPEQRPSIGSEDHDHALVDLADRAQRA